METCERITVTERNSATDFYFNLQSDYCGFGGGYWRRGDQTQQYDKDCRPITNITVPKSVYIYVPRTRSYCC